MKQKGSYILLISLDVKTHIQVGKLGELDFLPGHYLYCGSALNGLAKRIDHHLGTKKKLHWHIDYLLSSADVVEVWVNLSPQRMECQLAQAVLTLPGATVPVPGFGSSDCNCQTHLIGFSRKPGMAELQEIVGSAVTLELLVTPLYD